MENVRRDFQTLYHREEPYPHGLPLVTHMDPVQVNDADISESEVEA